MNGNYLADSQPACKSTETNTNVVRNIQHRNLNVIRVSLQTNTNHHINQIIQAYKLHN